MDAMRAKAIEMLIDGQEQGAIDFLRSNPEEVVEFCLSVQDRYAETDRTTPMILVARIIEKLL